jgi:EamA domain-containing membrane protein RarD
MLCTAELDMANTVVTSDIDAFLTNAAWAIPSTYHTALKASPGAAIFGRDMLFDIPFLLTGTQLENTGNAKQTLTQNVKIAHIVIGTTKLVIKCFLEKMVSSANQRVGMNVILGLSNSSYKWDH